MVRTPASPAPRSSTLPARSLERAHWFVDAFDCHLERAEMHADALERLQIEVRLHRFRRIHVNGLHEPPRFVGANREKCQSDRTQPMPDLVEDASIRGVA